MLAENMLLQRHVAAHASCSIPARHAPRCNPATPPELRFSKRRSGPVYIKSYLYLRLYLAGKAAGTDKLLGAEAAVLAAGGNVVRYVGLYHTQRGAHTFFFKAKEIQRPGSYVVNLLHYEDAASLAAAVLAAGSKFRGKAFIGCDDEPVTFQARVAAVCDCREYGVWAALRCVSPVPR